MEQERWQWQEPGKAWKGAGLYHITLTVTSRRAVLGALIVPDNDAARAYLQRSPLGDALVDCLLSIPQHHPEVRVSHFCLMPDHLCCIVCAAHDGQRHRDVSAGFLFEEMPFIRPMGRYSQLPNTIRYLDMNPQRLATKRLKPGFFRVQQNIVIGSRSYNGVGNIALLTAEDICSNLSCND